MIFRCPTQAYYMYSDPHFLVELRGFEPLTPSMRRRWGGVTAFSSAKPRKRDPAD
jgi:hypothetical protein